MKIEVLMKRVFFVPALFLLFARVEAQDTNFTASANLVIIDATVRDRGESGSRFEEERFHAF